MEYLHGGSIRDSARYLRNATCNAYIRGNNFWQNATVRKATTNNELVCINLRKIMLEAEEFLHRLKDLRYKDST